MECKKIFKPEGKYVPEDVVKLWGGGVELRTHSFFYMVTRLG
jgi:hypothetical protein